MRPYIGESLVYTFADSGRNSDNGVGAYLGGGIPLNQWFNIEFGGTYDHFNADKGSPPSDPWRQYGANIEGQYFFTRSREFSPYFALGGGYTKDVLKNVGRDSTGHAVAGVGAIHYFKLWKTDFGVRGDARYRWTFIDDAKFPGRNVGSSFGEPVLSVGLVIPLGGEAAPPPEVPAPAAKPMPKPQPAALDPNHRYEDIHFAFDKSDLTDYAQQSLDSDAHSINELAGKFPSLKVDIFGHTDWIGTDAYNQALSERRANSVKGYLIRKGVDAGRIRTYAYGESQPVAPNTTREGRALNRRAEVRTTNP